MTTLIARTFDDATMDTPIGTLLLWVALVSVIAIVIGMVVMLFRGTPERPEPPQEPRQAPRPRLCGVSGCPRVAAYIDQHIDGTLLPTCPGDHDRLGREGWIVLPDTSKRLAGDRS